MRIPGIRRPGPVLLTAVLALTGCSWSGDEGGLTIRLAELPAGTEGPIYVTGSFNGWDPGAEGYRLTREGGEYSIDLPDVRGEVELKFTRGSWLTVEVDSTGAELPNRRVQVPDTGAVYEAAVARWRDPCDWPFPSSTATASVSILDCAFPMEALGRDRRVWLYLPPDYEASDRRYPVLYMHDGQNVFDTATSYSGEWGVDETLDSLHAAGDPGAIVVAIDNGGERRLDEYSPWENPRAGGGGEGQAYVSFLADSLKAYIDATYRTLPGREHTGIAGSSMGGLISLYAALERPDVFGRVGVFSPAFWFAPAIFDLARERPIPDGTRLYMVTGGREGDRAAAYSGDHERMARLLRETADPGAAFETVIRPEGTHSERFWREEFAAAYRWLFTP